MRIAIVIGSTRPGRKADSVARWVYDQAAKRGDATFEIVDIADYDLPHLDEPIPPAAGKYRHPHTRAWAATVASYDGFVFVTPEYNHAPTGVLKNALDFIYREWNNKAAGFVGYGATGGVRAVEQLRLIVGELQIADVRSQVGLSVFHDFTDGVPTPGERHEKALAATLDQVVAWSAALQPLRAA